MRSLAQEKVFDRSSIASTSEAVAFFLEGTNKYPLLAEMRDGLVRIAQKRATKVIVRRSDEPWEVVIEERPGELAFSLLRAGAAPEIVMLDRPTSWLEMSELVSWQLPAGFSRENDGPQSSVRVVVEGERGAPVAVSASFMMRDTSSSLDADVERADLHALLFAGEMSVDVRSRKVDLGTVFPFLVGEDLIRAAGRILGAWERGVSETVAMRVGDTSVKFVVSQESVALTFMRASMNYTFPALSVADVVDTALTFSRSIVRAILRRDPGQAANLRLGALRRDARALGEALTEVSKEDVKTNPSPETYRGYLPRAQVNTANSPAAQRLRYGQRWRAVVAGINLRGTFLCGEKFIVDGRTETYGLDRTNGKVLWKIATTPAFSMPSPVGLARLGVDGVLSVFELQSGGLLSRKALLPRLETSPSAAVVQAPGIPSLLLVMEGRSHLLAVDLPSGEPRWRLPWSGGGIRTKRAGRLMVMSGGDSALVAVDLSSGSVVWRQRNRLRFIATPSLARDTVFALAGGAHSMAELLAIDACSGELRFRKEVLREPCSIEGSPMVSEKCIAVAVRSRRGLRLMGFSSTDGEPMWNMSEAVAPLGTSWLTVDDLFIGNTPNGELVAVEAETGRVRYRHLLGTSLESDVPRRLEPVLRSGALFVPHADVHVFRPQDGVEIGRIGPCHAIPDLLRVDEQCNVYIAEESGHVAAFGVGPKLTLVKG